jgi:hypothetical protein
VVEVEVETMSGDGGGLNQAELTNQIKNKEKKRKKIAIAEFHFFED